MYEVKIKTSITWHIGFYFCKLIIWLNSKALFKLARKINPKIFTMKMGTDKRPQFMVRYLKDLDIE